MRTSPQQRVAAFSASAALGMMILKLAIGFTTGSLGLVAEGLHSATDFIAALLTFFVLGVALRPADRSHQFGHGKAEHLIALAEAAALFVASTLIIIKSTERLAAGDAHSVDAAWYAIAVMGAILAVDISRAIVSFKAARRYRSPALAANGWHFVSDIGGTSAVLLGLVLVSAGYPAADSIAALLVAVLVLAAAFRITAHNVNALMDRVPEAVEAKAREAILNVDQALELKRLRVREAAGRTFADVIIAVPATEVVGQGHAVADLVEQAIAKALPESDVVVHVEPKSLESAALRERVYAVAASIPGVHEIHNLRVLKVASSFEVSLHLKLPANSSLGDAHDAATRLEQVICKSVEEVSVVQTHIEPLSTAPQVGDEVSLDDVEEQTKLITDVVELVSGLSLRKVKFVRTEDGLVAYLTLVLDPGQSLGAAHEMAGKVKSKVLSVDDCITEVFIHTEP